MGSERQGLDDMRAIRPGGPAPACVCPLLGRIRSSLENPQLVGSDGYRKRYLRIQCWVLMWRLLILVQIPEVALVRPDMLGPPSLAFGLLALALAYAVIHYLVATRTSATGKPWLQLMDLAACALLMFLAREPKLLFIISFYSYSSLLSRPTRRLAVLGSAMAGLSLAFVAAAASLGMSPLELLQQPREVDNLVPYYFWGLGFIGFSGVIERVSALEMEGVIAADRGP